MNDVDGLVGTDAAFRRVEIAAVVAFPLAAVGLFARTSDALASPAFAIGAFVVGALVADLGSGFVHWLFDTWFSPDTPWVGRAFVRTFREHHADPTAICRHDFVETNGSNMLAGGALVVAAHGVETIGSSFAAASLLFAAILTAVTAQIHKWAHAPRAPRVVAWLQRVGLILSPEAHAAHHAAPFDRAYCITCGWLNDALHRVAFFRTLERVVRATTGAVPRRHE